MWTRRCAWCKVKMSVFSSCNQRDLSSITKLDKPLCRLPRPSSFQAVPCWTVLLSQPLSFTVSSGGSLYYSSPPLPGYLYHLLQSVCLHALLPASVDSDTDISTCVSSFGPACNFWA